MLTCCTVSITVRKSYKAVSSSSHNLRIQSVEATVPYSINYSKLFVLNFVIYFESFPFWNNELETRNVQ